MQKICVTGNVGRNPEMRYTPQGIPVADFSLATTRRWNDTNGNRQEKTTWFKIVFWRKQAETIAQYVVKGSKLLVWGELDVEAYINKEGQAVGVLKITGTEFEFLTPAPGSNGNGNGNYQGNVQAPYEAELVEGAVAEDIPF